MYNGQFDFTFEWEISIPQPSNGFQFLQKGTLLLSFNANNALVVTFTNTQQSFSSVSLSSKNNCFIYMVIILKMQTGGFNAFRLYCSNYQRLTIFCELWINEQDQGSISFPFPLDFSDSSSSSIMIPPPSSGANMFQGIINRFLIANNFTTIYPISTNSFFNLSMLLINFLFCY